MAASSSTIKRKFYENNISGLNYPSVNNGSKSNIGLQSIRHKKSAALPANRSQLSLFGEIEHQPGAEDWIQQRKGKETLNKNASSIAEYDGDVFLPTGMLLVVKQLVRFLKEYYVVHYTRF